MDIKTINSQYLQIKYKYLEQQIQDKEIIEKALIFFNKYYNLIEHPFTLKDINKLSNVDFSIKLDFLHWKSINPITENEVNKFYRDTPFEFFKNLFKNMDIMHYEKIISEAILPILKNEKYKTVLDYGGGSGYQSILLHKLGYEVTFAEINKISIEWMKYVTKELNFNIKVIDLNKEKIVDNYDLIILKDVIEHLVNPNPTFDLLRNKTKDLLIIPDKIEKEEDYLPMHFLYNIKNGKL